MKGPESGFVGDIPLSTPQKRNMSEGCWLFTLKMAVQLLHTGTLFSGDFSQM